MNLLELATELEAVAAKAQADSNRILQTIRALRIAQRQLSTRKAPYPRYYDRGESRRARVYRVTKAGARPEFFNRNPTQSRPLKWEKSRDHSSEDSLAVCATLITKATANKIK